MDTSHAHTMNHRDDEQQLPAMLSKNLDALADANSETHRVLVEYLPDLAFSVTSPLPGIAVTHNAQTYEVLTYPDYSALAALPKVDNRSSVCLIIGIGSGHELIELYKRTDNTDKNTLGSTLPLYVLEPDPCALLAVLCVHDLSTALDSGRLLIWAGSQSLDRYIAYMSENRQAMFPTQHLLFLPPDEIAFARQAVTRINQLTETAAQRIDTLEQAVSDYYAGMDNNAWREVYATADRPLRILGCTSRFTTFLQYCMRDLLSGFDKLGCTTLLHQETSAIMRTTKYDLLATINEFHPDLIIYIDHFRDEYPYLPVNVPFFNWIQDLLPGITDPETRSLAALDFTSVFVPQWIDTLQGKPCYRNHDISLLPLGINTDVYHPCPEIGAEFDVLYVSHLPEPSATLMPLRDTRIAFDPNKDEAELLHNNSIDLQQLVIVYLMMMKTLDGLLIDDLWRYVVDPKIRRSFVMRNLQNSETAAHEILIEHLCNSTRINQDIMLAVKYRPIRALVEKGFDVRVYGRHWERYPGIGSAAQGIAENGTPLNELMNKARLCINNSPGTSFHMRALEILGSGTFMLSRRIPYDAFDIADYFVKDAEIFFFSNELDVVGNVRRFLADEELRTGLAQQCHQKAIAGFGYDKTAGHILEKIRARLDQ